MVCRKEDLEVCQEVCDESGSESGAESESGVKSGERCRELFRRRLMTGGRMGNAKSAIVEDTAKDIQT